MNVVAFTFANEEKLDNVIDREVDYLLPMNQPFTWKVYDHDPLPSLREAPLQVPLDVLALRPCLDGAEDPTVRAVVVIVLNEGPDGEQVIVAGDSIAEVVCRPGSVLWRVGHRQHRLVPVAELRVHSRQAENMSRLVAAHASKVSFTLRSEPDRDRGSRLLRRVP